MDEIRRLRALAELIAAQAKGANGIEHRRELHRQYDYLQDRILDLKNADEGPSRIEVLFGWIKKLSLKEQVMLYGMLGRILYEAKKEPTDGPQ